MEQFISLIGVLFTIIGSFVWLGIALGNLKGRLDTLEGKKHFERVELEFTQKLETLIDRAREKLQHELNPEPILRNIQAAQQHAMQQIAEVKTVVQELDVAKQQALQEIEFAHAPERLSELKQALNQAIEQFVIQTTDVVNQAEARHLELKRDVSDNFDKFCQQQVELEQQLKQATSEVVQAKNDALKELKHTVLFRDPVTALAETLPEITFEAFIENNKKIRPETRKARQLTEILPGGVKLELIYIPGGTFMMGTGDGDNDEKPVHPVVLKPFFVGKYLMTQAQWEAVMGNNPSYFKGENHPIETITWHEAMECCTKLSQLTGQHYYLLSEAQWEYVCRAGTITKYSFGDIIAPEFANYADGKINQTTAVGKYPANGFGLYDMHGNVSEWCEDVWHGNYNGAPSDGSAWISGGESNKHIIRGGSWLSGDQRLRCTYRNSNYIADRSYLIGFRIARM